jgi:hypothetical protein
VRLGLASAAVLLVGLQAGAEVGSPSDSGETLADRWMRAFSQDALDRMRGAVEAQVDFGYTTFTDTSTTAFRSSSPGITSAPWFSGGTAFRLAAAYRWRFLGLGVEGSWYTLGSSVSYVIGASPTIADSFNAGDYAAFERLHLTDPGSRVQLSFDLREGWGVLTDNEVLVTFAPASTTITAGVLGARLNIGFRPFAAMPGLQLGAFVGGSAWFAVNACSTGGGPSQCSGQGLGSNFAFMAGISGNFTLPVRGPPALEYVLVESRQAPTPDVAAPEVSDTAAYRERRGKIHQVALLAPPSCPASNERSRLGARCGVEMAEIERGLIKRGFGVTSWRALNAMVQDAQVTPTEAAARLGAQVLFQVNALERVMGKVEKRAASESRYFASDAFGSQGAQVDLPAHDRTVLSQVVDRSTLGDQSKTRVGAALDINAILVPSGEAFWSYRRQKMDSGSASEGTSVLARREGDDGWARAEPAWGSDGQSLIEEHNDMGAAAQQASYYRLLREVVTECVHQFADPES